MMRFVLLGIGLAGIGAVMWSSFRFSGLPATPSLTHRWRLEAGPVLTVALAREQATYQRDVELQLEAYEQRLARLRKEAAAATPQAREALMLEVTIAQLEDGLQRAQQALAALRRAGEGTWLTRRVAMEEALQVLDQSFTQRAGRSLLASQRVS